MKINNFIPATFLGNKHIQTLVGILIKPSSNFIQKNSKDVKLKIDKNTSLLLNINLQENRLSSKTAIMIHGLTGSANSSYILRIATKLYNKGYNIIRMNLRNCGETEYLTTSLYHAGQSSDLQAVINYCIKEGF